MDNRDSEIIKNVLAGNNEAFGELIELYQRKIYNLMYRLTLSSEDASDLTQDAFVKAYENLSSFNVKKKFLPWLYVIAANLARDWGRRERMRFRKVLHNREDLVLNGESLPLESSLENRQEQAFVREALRSLSFDDREALILRFRDELTMVEIAEVFRLSTSGAKMKIKRALTKLRGIYSETT